MIPIIRFRRGEKFVVTFFLAVLILTLALAVIVFFPSAKINIKTKSEPIAITIGVRLDSRLYKFSPALLALPARITAKNEYLKIKDSIEHDWITDDRLTVGGDESERVILYRQADLELLARHEMAEVLRHGWEILPASQLAIKLQEVSIDADQAGALVTVAVEAKAVPDLPFDKWQNQAGERPEQLQAEIEAIDGVDDVKVSISPSFWPFLPLRYNNIEFKASAIDTE